jgi:hypothetical protein
MEDQNGAASDSVVAAPFSELISAWLDEGDRLDEKAIATTASVPPVVETRARRVLARLRPVFNRHRVLVLAGVGLVPLALFLLTTRSAPASVPALVIAPATLATPPPRPLPAVPTPLVASMILHPTAPTAPSETPGFCEQPQAGPTVAEVRSLDPRPAAHRHHHHHSVKHGPACGLHAPCAVKRSTPGGHAASVASARPGPAPGRGQARR